MTMQSCRPLLNVADVEASLGFWRDLLGFEVTTTYQAEGRLAFAQLASGDVQLMRYFRCGDPVGRYDLDVQATGFESYERKDIVLDTDASLTLDCPLKVGAISQTVSVTDNALHVETVSPR